MRLAIFSDLHDNMSNLDIFLDWTNNEKIESILFCGDATREESLARLSQRFPGKIHLIEGNAETYKTSSLEKYSNITDYGRDAYIELDGLKMLATHKKKDIKDALKYAPQAPDFIFYGHNHKPWLEKNNDIIMANPGNLADIYYPATFAVLDTEISKLELKILSDILQNSN